MAMEQREARIVSGKIHFHLLVASYHHDIFHHALGRNTCDLVQFETVPMKMYRMNVVTGIAHAQAVAPSLPQTEGWCHVIAGKHLVVDRPCVESVVGCVPLGKGHVNYFVGLWSNCFSLREARVVPMKRLRRRPCRLSFLS